jgi:hypothetical protein
VAVFSALLPFYASPCSAVSRWWRIALAPGFVGPLCCIASIQHARSPDTRGFSLSLSNSQQAPATVSRHVSDTCCSMVWKAVAGSVKASRRACGVGFVARRRHSRQDEYRMSRRPAHAALTPTCHLNLTSPHRSSTRRALRSRPPTTGLAARCACRSATSLCCARTWPLARPHARAAAHGGPLRAHVVVCGAHLGARLGHPPGEAVDSRHATGAGSGAGGAGCGTGKGRADPRGRSWSARRGGSSYRCQG